MATMQYFRYNALAKVLVAEQNFIVMKNGSTIVNPTAEQYATLRDAYKKGEDAPMPTPPEGKVVEYGGYELGESDKLWHKQWVLDDAPPPPPRVWTPLAIKRACGERWCELRSALDALGVLDDFLLAQELREDDEAFARGRARAVETFGEEAVEAVLEEAAHG